MSISDDFWVDVETKTVNYVGSGNIYTLDDLVRYVMVQRVRLVALPPIIDKRLLSGAGKYIIRS